MNEWVRRYTWEFPHKTACSQHQMNEHMPYIIQLHIMSIQQIKQQNIWSIQHQYWEEGGKERDRGLELEL